MTAFGALPRRSSEWLCAGVLALLGAGLLVAISDLKHIYQAAMLVGMAGVIALAALPNRRILLVGAWAFLHPLSLEKVARIFTETHPKFLPPTLVLCGSDLALLGLIAVLVMEGTIQRRKVFFWPAAATPYALLCAWVVVEFILLLPTPMGMIQVLHWLKLLLSMIVLSSAIRTRQELLFVLAIVAISVGLQSAFVGISYFTHKKIGFSAVVANSALQGFTSGGAVNFVRASGTLGHANQQAMFHTFLTFPLIGLCCLRNTLWRSVAAIIIVASLVATALTFSRSSWLACSLAAATIIFVAHRRGLMTRRSWSYLFMGLFAGVLLIAPLSKAIYNRITKGDDGASASRIRMARMATDYILRFPITGVGPGNFIEQKISEARMDRTPNTWLPRNKDWIAPTVGEMEMYEEEVEGRWYYFPGVVHNKYLQVCSELGLIGLTLFLWYQWRVWQHCLRASRAATAVGSWTGIGLLAAFFASVFFFNLDLFYDDKTVLVPIFMNVLAMAADRITTQERLLGG